MKTKTLIPSLFLLLIATMVFSQFPQINAAGSYYNWLQNPSFNVYVDYCEDGGFESGNFSSGVTYGNWTNSYGTNEGFRIIQDYPHSGVSSVRIGSTMALSMGRYDITCDNISCEDIVELSFYAKQFETYSDTLRVYFFYTDSTSDYSEFSTSGVTSWTKFDVTDDLDLLKELSSFNFTDTDVDTGLSLIDDVVLLVDDGEGQDDIGISTVPWFEEYIVQYDYENPNEEDDFTEMNATVGRLDNTSGQIALYDTIYLSQAVNYLDTSTVEYVNCYVYSDYNETIDIYCRVDYSDGTWDYRVMPYDCDSTWTEIFFGKSWLDEDKFIIKIQFGLNVDNIGLQEDFDGILNFDDCAIWSSNPVNWLSFDYVVTPAAGVHTQYAFSAWQGVEYTITVYKYDDNQDLTEEGNYTYSDTKGVQTGNMVNGVFSVTLDVRSAANQFYETVSFQIVTDSEVFVFQLTITWMKAAAGSYTSSGGEDEAELYDGRISGGELLYYMAIFLVVIFPCLAITAVTGSSTYAMAFLALGLMTGIATGLIEWWWVIVGIVVLVILMFVPEKLGRR